MLLSVKDISVHYQKVQAVSSISFEIDKGTITVIIGANGAGKSTVLKAIAGLKRISSGRISLDEKRIDEWSIEKIVSSGISMVPEGRGLFATMSVQENLNMGSYLRKNKARVKENLAEIYDRFPILREKRHEKAQRLSGGQQQILAIAISIMSDPRLMLLDEPSLGLAPLIIQEVARILRNINEGGLTVILVEQNASMALKLAHRGLVIERGKIILRGEAEELLQNNDIRKAYLSV